MAWRTRWRKRLSESWGRLAAGAAGLALIAVGVSPVLDQYREEVAFDRAPYCSTPPPADTSHCKVRVSMTVVDGSESGAGPSTDDYVTVRTADGRRHEFKVSRDFYRAAHLGAIGTAEMWHGHVLRLRIGSQVEGEEPWRWAIWAVAVLVGAGLLVYPVYSLLRWVKDTIVWWYRRALSRLRRSG